MTLVRVTAFADLRCAKTSQGAFPKLFARVSESADIAVIAGVLTEYGLPEEAAVLARELTRSEFRRRRRSATTMWKPGGPVRCVRC